MICADLQISIENNSDIENRTSKNVPKPLDIVCSNAPKNQITSMWDSSSSTWSIPVMSSLVQTENGLNVPWFEYETYDLFNQKFRKDEDGIKREGGSVFAVSLPDLKVRKNGKFQGYWNIDPEVIFEAWKNVVAPSIRWSSGLRRPLSMFDKEIGRRGKTSWAPFKTNMDGDEVRHSIVIDIDRLPENVNLDDVKNFFMDYGFNGVITNVKADCISMNAPLHFNGLVDSRGVHEFVDNMALILNHKFGITVDLVGSKGWMCKNIFMIEKIEKSIEEGLPFEVGHKTWSNWSQQRRDWKKHESWWFDFSEDGTIPLSGSWSQHADIWNRSLVDLGSVVHELEKIIIPVSSPIETSISSSSSLSSSLSCFKEVKVPKTPKTSKNPIQQADENISRWAYANTHAFRDMLRILRESGCETFNETHHDEFILVHEKHEKASPEYGRQKRTNNDEGDDIWERKWKWCLKQSKEYWKNYLDNTKVDEKWNLRKSAGKLLKIAKFAFKNDVKGGDERIKKGYENLMTLSIFTHPYIQKIISEEFSSSRTLALYRKTIRDYDSFVSQVREILNQGTGLDFLDESLLSLLFSSSLSSSSSSCFKEVKVTFQSIDERIEALKTQSKRSEEYSRNIPKRSNEDEKWLHVEKVDNFDHLNTDFENRMMGKEYIRDAEKYHVEGLYSLRDEAVQMARSYGYIGDFSWEDSKSAGIDWENIHGKVFKTEEKKENKPQSAPVSFADIRARLRRMG